MAFLLRDRTTFTWRGPLVGGPPGFAELCTSCPLFCATCFP